jgi:hypothetical protein
VATSPQSEPDTRRVIVAPLGSRITRRPVTRFPARRRSTLKVRAVSDLVASRALAVRSNTRSSNSAMLGQPGSARYSMRIGSLSARATPARESTTQESKKLQQAMADRRKGAMCRHYPWVVEVASAAAVLGGKACRDRRTRVRNCEARALCANLFA